MGQPSDGRPPLSSGRCSSSSAPGRTTTTSATRSWYRAAGLSSGAAGIVHGRSRHESICSTSSHKGGMYRVLLATDEFVGRLWQVNDGIASLAEAVVVGTQWAGAPLRLGRQPRQQLRGRLFDQATTVLVIGDDRLTWHSVNVESAGGDMAREDMPLHGRNIQLGFVRHLRGRITIDDSMPISLRCVVIVDVPARTTLVLSMPEITAKPIAAAAPGSGSGTLTSGAAL